MLPIVLLTATGGLQLSVPKEVWRMIDDIYRHGMSERDLFLKYNYARFRSARIQEKLSGRRPTMKQQQEFLKWHGLAHEYRKQIAETNLALVLAMAKRTRMHGQDRCQTAR